MIIIGSADNDRMNAYTWWIALGVPIPIFQVFEPTAALAVHATDLLFDNTRVPLCMQYDHGAAGFMQV